MDTCIIWQKHSGKSPCSFRQIWIYHATSTTPLHCFESRMKCSCKLPEIYCCVRNTRDQKVKLNAPTIAYSQHNSLGEQKSRASPCVFTSTWT
jgi:hypothetical protein